MKLKHSSIHSSVFPGLGAHTGPPCSRDVARARTVGLPSVGYLHCVLSRQNEFLPVNKRVDFTTVNQAADCSWCAPVFALFPRFPSERDYTPRMCVFIDGVSQKLCALPLYRKCRIGANTLGLQTTFFGHDNNYQRFSYFDYL